MVQEDLHAVDKATNAGVVEGVAAAASVGYPWVGTLNCKDNPVNARGERSAGCSHRPGCLLADHSGGPSILCVRDYVTSVTTVYCTVI